ncbi:MAG: PilZ domain-containing protein [Thermodesulfobacteriota bacterium]|nr:PilZ domain-containing protein [Thermodesulfobacteriota bacterium]
MEKRQSKRETTLDWEDIFANAKIGATDIKLPVLDISIGGMGVLVTEGFSQLKEGIEIQIETLEKQGTIIATSINGRIAYLGPGVPSKVGIDFSPDDTPIEAYTKLNQNGSGVIITDKNEIEHTFNEIKAHSRGFGDMLIMSRHKVIPAEFFYLRPENDNMVLRIVRISELRLPFQPEKETVYPFYLFKGINVMLFKAKVIDVVKNIIETSWPDKLQYLSRRSVLRYLVTGNDPITARIVHPISAKENHAFVWDISEEGMGVELMNKDIPIIEGMHLDKIHIDLPKGHIEAAGIVRSVVAENLLHKTRIGVEFIQGSPYYQDQILKFLLDKDFPSEDLLSHTM